MSKKIFIFLFLISNFAYAQDGFKSSLDWAIGYNLPPSSYIPEYGYIGYRVNIEGHNIGLKLDIPDIFSRKTLSLTPEYLYEALIATEHYMLSAGVGINLKISLNNNPVRVIPMYRIVNTFILNDLINIELYYDGSLDLRDFSSLEYISDAGLTIILPELDNFFADFKVHGIGRYSTETRSYLGSPSLSLGVRSEF